MSTLDEDMAEQERLAAAIAQILARHDPAAVGPGKYSDENEYASEARHIANWIRQNADLARRDSQRLSEEIRRLLEQRFGVDCHRIEEVTKEIQKLFTEPK
jgi:hypothetical protein